MIHKPVLLPAWVVGLMAFAGGIWSAIGIIAVVAIFQTQIVQRQPFTPEERRNLEEYMPNGSYVDPGTYRKCINGAVWFYYAGGSQATYGAPCWH